MMMITQMTKISLFVLAGMISGSSAIDCSQFDNNKDKCLAHGDKCSWIETGKCRNSTMPPFFVSLEAGVGVGREHWSQEKEDYDVGIHWPHYIDTFEYDDNDASDIKKYLRAN